MRNRLKQTMPALGLASAVAWGATNLAEHRIHQGWLPKNKVWTGLALAAPLANATYGVINTAAAGLSGYAWRAGAFALYGAASLAMAPLFWKDTRLSLKLSKALAQGNQDLAKDIARQGLHVRQWTALGNLMVPVGLLMGLFSVTKVAQSKTPLEPPGENLLADLAHNAKVEAQSFAEELGQLPAHSKQSLTDVRRGLETVNTPTEKNAWQRFAQPVQDGPTVPVLYSLTALGRLAAAVGAASVFALSPKAVAAHSPFQRVLKELPPAGLAKPLMKGVNGSVVGGQVASALSSVFTQFNGWPAGLSALYVSSALPDAASALSAMTGRRFWGMDASTLARASAFIQGNAYFLNAARPEKPSSVPTAPSFSAISAPVENPMLQTAAIHPLTNGTMLPAVQPPAINTDLADPLPQPSVILQG